MHLKMSAKCWPICSGLKHYNGAMVSQITGVSIVCLTVGSDTDQRKHQSSASLAIVWGIHRWPVNSPHKRPVTRKMFPFDEVMMVLLTPLVAKRRSRQCLTIHRDGRYFIINAIEFTIKNDVILWLLCGPVIILSQTIVMVDNEQYGGQGRHRPA